MGLRYTKAVLEGVLREKAGATGGQLVNLGGDCWAVFVDGEPRLGVALKESTMTGTLWVGNPDPLFNAIAAQLRLPGSNEPFQLHIARAFIALYHVPRKTLLVIPIVDVYNTLLSNAKDRPDKSIKPAFDILVQGYHKYALRVGEFRKETPIRYIQDPGPLFDLIALPT